MKAGIDSPECTIMIPKRGGFGGPPVGHEIHYARILFDDEADVTVGCLLLSCHPPDLDPSAEGPWTGEPLNWIAYGDEGKIYRGTTDT